MSKKSKLNGLSSFLASKNGRLFFHITYSVGASIVILGALAKIIHLPMGNMMLIIGMLVEALVFLLSAFDVDQVDYQQDSDTAVDMYSAQSNTFSTAVGNSSSGSNFISGKEGRSNQGGAISIGGNINISEKDAEKIEQTTQKMADFSKIMTNLNDMSEKIMEGCQQMTNGEFGGLSNNMMRLNENIFRLNSVYEAQLSSIETQMSTLSYIGQSLERIKTLYSNTVVDSDMFRIENERMTRQIQELNRIYSRLLQAMNAGVPNNQPYSQQPVYYSNPPQGYQQDNPQSGQTKPGNLHNTQY